MPEFPSYVVLTAPAADDLLLAVDVHDTTMSPAGTTKQVTVGAVVPAATTGAAGTVQLAGDLGGTSASPQVKGTHLASPLPIAQGGTGTGTAAPQNDVFAGPASGGPGAPAFRALQAADIPSLPYDASGAAAAVASAVAAEIGAAGGIAPLDSSSPLAVLPKARLPYVVRSDYKFAPEEYGGVADAMAVSDGAMNSSSSPTVLACTTSTPFHSGDVGKYVYVAGAGSGGAPLYATITGYTDSGHVTLSVAASTTVSSTGVAFGTDNAGPIKSARADLYTFCAGSPREGALVFLGGGGYGVGSAPVLGGSTLGNGIIPLPPVPDIGRKLRMRLAADADGAPLLHWLQQVPQINGPAIVVLSAPVAVDSTYGPPSVFGAPYDGYGAAASLFSNMQVVVDGLSVATPWDSGYLAYDFFGLAEAVVLSGSKIAMATVGGGHGWPDITQYGSLARTSCGLRMPDVNNNDRCDVLYWSSEGDVYGAMLSEHGDLANGRAIYCFVGIQMYGGAASPHWGHIGTLSAETCTYGIGVMPGGITGFPGGNLVKLIADRMDIESAGVLNDPSDLMSGHVGVVGNYTSSYDGFTINNGTGVEIIDKAAPKGLISSPHIQPATGNPWANLYNVPVEVTLSVSGGTLSALTLTSGTEIVPASCTWYRFELASRHSYTPTFTGVLTHTVKRL